MIDSVSSNPRPDEHEAPAPPQGKSQRTRQQILEATLHCLADWGYSHTTNESIAMRAKVSRGAVTHHFPSRIALFQEFAVYLMESQAAEYTDMVRRIASGLDGGPTFEAMRLTLDLMHHDYSTSACFHALQEFMRGTRGIRTLGKLAATLAKDIDTRERQIRTDLLPARYTIPERCGVLRDLTVYVLASVSLTPGLCADPTRRDRLFNLVALAAMTELERAQQSR